MNDIAASDEVWGVIPVKGGAVELCPLADFFQLANHRARPHRPRQAQHSSPLVMFSATYVHC